MEGIGLAQNTGLLLVQLALITLLSITCLLELINPPKISLKNAIGKLAITALWIVIISSVFLDLPGYFSSVLYFTAFLLAAVHAMECVSLHREIRVHHSNLLTGYLLVMLFGGLHAAQWQK